MSLTDFLLTGSYVFSAFVWMLIWREVKSLRTVVDAMRQELAREIGRREGQDHERRISSLEMTRAHTT